MKFEIQEADWNRAHLLHSLVGLFRSSVSVWEIPNENWDKFSLMNSFQDSELHSFQDLLGVRLLPPPAPPNYKFRWEAARILASLSGGYSMAGWENSSTIWQVELLWIRFFLDLDPAAFYPSRIRLRIQAGLADRGQSGCNQEATHHGYLHLQHLLNQLCHVIIT